MNDLELVSVEFTGVYTVVPRKGPKYLCLQGRHFKKISKNKIILSGIDNAGRCYWTFATVIHLVHFVKYIFVFKT